MKRIQIATKELQTQYHTLSDCCADLDILIEDVEMNKENPDHELYQCTLKKVYIGADSAKLPNKSFEGGVVKIQNGDIANMTVFEKNACASLQLNANVVGNMENDQPITYKERWEKFKNKSLYDGTDYGCVDFILGSAAVVERLWSIADGLIDDVCITTSPILMETLLYHVKIECIGMIG